MTGKVNCIITATFGHSLHVLILVRLSVSLAFIILRIASSRIAPNIILTGRYSGCPKNAFLPMTESTKAYRFYGKNRDKVTIWKLCLATSYDGWSRLLLNLEQNLSLIILLHVVYEHLQAVWWVRSRLPAISLIVGSCSLLSSLYGPKIAHAVSNAPRTHY